MLRPETGQVGRFRCESLQDRCQSFLWASLSRKLVELPACRKHRANHPEGQRIQSFSYLPDETHAFQARSYRFYATRRGKSVRGHHSRSSKDPVFRTHGRGGTVGELDLKEPFLIRQAPFIVCRIATAPRARLIADLSQKIRRLMATESSMFRLANCPAETKHPIAIAQSADARRDLNKPESSSSGRRTTPRHYGNYLRQALKQGLSPIPLAIYKVSKRTVFNRGPIEQ